MSHEQPNRYQATIDKIRAMTDEETLASLQQAGILDENGQLTERYRPPEEDPEPTPT